jgi:hypothetical protein
MIDTHRQLLPCATTPLCGHEALHSSNPYDSIPDPPCGQRNRLVSSVVSLQLLRDFAVPIFDVPSSPSSSSPSSPRGCAKKIKPSYPYLAPTANSSPLFYAALERMRSGEALRRLKLELDAAKQRNSGNGTTGMTGGEATTTTATEAEQEASRRLSALAGASLEKGPTHPAVKLGRALQRRNSGMARSA